MAKRTRRKILHMWEIKTRKPRRYTLLVQASNIRTALKMVREAGHSEVKSIEKVN